MFSNISSSHKTDIFRNINCLYKTTPKHEINIYLHLILCVETLFQAGVKLKEDNKKILQNNPI